jgi:hypothetical protein
MKRFAIVLALVCVLAARAESQTTTGPLQANISWPADAASTTTTPGSYAVLRAPLGSAANCAAVAATAYAALSTSLAVLTYGDATIVPGSTYCYAVTFTSPIYSPPTSAPSAALQLLAALSGPPSAPGAPAGNVTQVTVTTTTTTKTVTTISPAAVK